MAADGVSALGDAEIWFSNEYSEANAGAPILSTAGISRAITGAGFAVCFAIEETGGCAMDNTVDVAIMLTESKSFLILYWLFILLLSGPYEGVWANGIAGVCRPSVLQR